MNDENWLRLQSWVDGELPEAEAARVAAWVAEDREAAALAAELRMTRQVLAENEPQAVLQESREFYWSGIQRAIEREEAAAAANAPAGGGLPWMLALRRLLVPITGFALVALVTLLSTRGLNRPDSLLDFGQLVEVENLSEGVDSMAYKSQSENMFVVYVFNQESAATSSEGMEDGEPDLFLDEDGMLQ
ncbi:MAG: hypothetical protein RJA22_808 [Verrucomicrobiota bacterium]|jgi:hypothetical protein